MLTDLLNKRVRPMLRKVGFGRAYARVFRSRDFARETFLHLRTRRSGVECTMKGGRVFAVGSHLGSSQMPVLRQDATVMIRFQMPPIIPGRYTLDIGFYDTEAGIDEEYYSAGAVEVAETNYLNMIEPVHPQIGQILVRSEIFTT